MIHRYWVIICTFIVAVILSITGLHLITVVARTIYQKKLSTEGFFVSTILTFLIVWFICQMWTAWVVILKRRRLYRHD